VHELIRTILIYAAVLGMILLGFYLYKESRYKVQIDATDRSMSPEYQTGGYSVMSGAIQVGDAVAFATPDKPEEWRVARVVALSGQRVEIDANGVVKVDGAASARKCDSLIRPLQFKVPSASVFILTDQPNYVDSSKLGPVPLYQVIGKLKPGT